VDLVQLFVAPTVAFKASEHHAFGVSLNIGYQRFSAKGIENFDNPNFSTSPASVNDRAGSGSFGAGFRVGWLGTLNKVLSLGATFQSRTYMQKFDKYKGLFAEHGGFDIPANVAGGVALKVHPKATFLFDAERIFYGQVKSIANPDFPIQAPLGSSNGPGFGWHDITAEKVDFSSQLSPKLTLRAGYNHSGLPFNPSQAFFNLLAPAVVQHHLTAGATLGLHDGKEISIAYQHAFAERGCTDCCGRNSRIERRRHRRYVRFLWRRHSCLPPRHSCRGRFSRREESRCCRQGRKVVATS
jgi:long-chain fatty acid transport protein